ncbi:hypothetical protein F5X99DRAFT_408147 [Biscogniauxia marginata]|nr:hypothetical protein F5X99DRAFT_408147 [Biscogniauxia marginata]
MRAQALFTTIFAASASAGVLPRAQQSNTFRLEVNVLNYDLTPSINGARVGFQMTDACLSDLLVEEGDGSIFYQSKATVLSPEANGPGSESAGIIVTPGGTATVPSRRYVQVECGNSTQGVQLEWIRETETSRLQYEAGTWMACPALDNESRIGIVYRRAGQRTLQGCAEVELLSICDSTGGNPEGSEPMNCKSA